MNGVKFGEWTVYTVLKFGSVSCQGINIICIRTDIKSVLELVILYIARKNAVVNTFQIVGTAVRILQRHFKTHVF
jgi:hypothetical protein